MIELKWTRDGCVMGFVANWGDVAAIDIWPHEKSGWSWCVVSADAEEEVPEGWDPTLEDAMVHSESAYLEWRDGEKEHDETADIVAHAVAQERAAVVAWLLRNHYDDTAERIERGEHRRGEGG